VKSRLALLGAALVLGAAPSHAQAPAEWAALREVNAARASLGRPPVALDPRLSAAARAACDRMAAAGGFARHSTPGELRAFGFPDGPAPPDARRDWRQNVTEGCLVGMNSGLAGDARQYVKSCMDRLPTDPGERHTHDLLLAGWNRVGMASRGEFFVIVLGRE
jgi:hypothetical protein